MADDITKGKAVEPLESRCALDLKEERPEEMRASDLRPEMLDPNSEEYIPELHESVKDASEKLLNIAAHFTNNRATQEALNSSNNLTKALNALREKLEALKPFIHELDEELKKPEYNGLSFTEIEEEGIDENGDIIPGSLLEKAINAAQKALASKEEQAQLGSEISAREIVEVTSLSYPRDKINKGVWNSKKVEKLAAENGLEDNGLLELEFNLAADKDKKDGKVIIAPVLLDYSAVQKDGVTLSKITTPYDLEVYVALDALRSAGNSVVTPAQILKVLGLNGAPTNHQRAKLKSSIDKMQATILTVDNEEEVKAGYNYPPFKRKEPLLPVKTLEYTYSKTGQSGYAVKFINDKEALPLIDFAKGRKQITTIPLQTIQVPISLTDNNMAIKNYLFGRISGMKHDKNANKKGKYNGVIRLDTLYTETGNEERKQKKRCKETAETILEYFKSEAGASYIKGYTITKDRIKIEL